MADYNSYEIDFVDKEALTIDFLEKEIVEVSLNTVAIVPEQKFFNSLEDVTLNNISEGQILAYDNTESAIVNRDLNSNIFEWDNEDLSIKDGGLGESKLDIENSPPSTSNKFLTYNPSTGKFKWEDVGVSGSISQHEIDYNHDLLHSHSNKTLLDSYDQSNDDIKDAINKAHEHTSSLSEIEDAIDKSHDQNTDLGTNSNDFYIGDGTTDVAKTITANNGDTHEPKIRYNEVSNSWQYSNDGINFSDLQPADMTQDVYDTDGDGIVDKAESIDDNQGNSKTAREIADAVDIAHTQNTDSKLDSGGANEITASTLRSHVDNNDKHREIDDSSTLSTVLWSADKINTELSGKADSGVVTSHESTYDHTLIHTQNTDTGTSNNNWSIGDDSDSDKTIIANNGDTDEPKIKYNSASNKWQYSNNGTDWYDFGVAPGGAGSGDMLKSVYDTDEDGIVDKAESIDDGTYTATAENISNSVDIAHDHTSSLSAIEDAVTKKHTQNTDTGTNQTSFQIGDGTDVTIELTANNADADKPKIRYNHSTNTWQLSNDGTTFNDIEAGTGSGDMLKSTYDADEDGDVDSGAGGTGIDSSSSTGIPKVTVGTWSIDADLDDLGDGSTYGRVKNTELSSNQVKQVRAVTASSDVSGDDIKDAVDIAHDHTSSLSAIEDAVTKKHTQNTDTGTNNDDWSIGDGSDTTKTITANNGDTDEPKIRYNHSANAWQYTNDGTNWYDFGVAGSGAGSGDMLKSIYDENEDGRVDEADKVSDGTDDLFIDYTTHDSFSIGDGTTNTDKYLYARNGDASKPALRYNETSNKWQFANDGSTWEDLGSGEALTVEELDGTPSVSPVDTIKIDQSTGLSVTDNGDGSVTIQIGSHWKDIQVDGQDTLTPSGEETLEIEAGTGVTLTTNTGTTPQKLTIASSGASYSTSFVDGDLSSGVLTVTHSLATKYVAVAIYDNNDKKIIPDEITLTDTNNLDIDLSSFGTLSGTWNVKVVG